MVPCADRGSAGHHGLAAARIELAGQLGVEAGDVGRRIQSAGGLPVGAELEPMDPGAAGVGRIVESQRRDEVQLDVTPVDIEHGAVQYRILRPEVPTAVQEDPALHLSKAEERASCRCWMPSGQYRLDRW